MTQIPDNLVPLPTMPYSERPLSLPLDPEECRTALWRTRGNITQAAALLKVTSARLRRFVRDSPYLSNELQECKEQLTDQAEEVLVEALEDTEDKQRRDKASYFILGTLGKQRGWGSGGSGKINIQNNGGKVIIGWEDGSSFDDSGDSNTIDGEVVDGGR